MKNDIIYFVPESFLASLKQKLVIVPIESTPAFIAVITNGKGIVSFSDDYFEDIKSLPHLFGVTVKFIANVPNTQIPTPYLLEKDSSWFVSDEEIYDKTQSEIDSDLGINESEADDGE